MRLSGLDLGSKLFVRKIESLSYLVWVFFEDVCKIEIENAQLDWKILISFLAALWNFDLNVF